MDNTKSKFALWVYPETMKKVSSLYLGDNCKSKSEFIEKAIQFYCGYLTAADYRDYLPNVLVSTMQGKLDSMENRIASLLFRTAVELSMMLHVVAATNEIDPETLDELRKLCVEDVKKLQGSLRFEDAFQFQKG